MIKNRIYTNGSKYLRIGAFTDDTSQAFVTNILELKSYYEDLEKIRDYREISFEQMLADTGKHVPEFNSLTANQRQLARRRYIVISSLLDNLQAGNDFLDYRVKELSAIYKVQSEDIWKWLSTYCAYGSMAMLVNSDERGCSLKPVLKVREFDCRYKEVGHSLLVHTKIASLGNNKTAWINLLYDTETNYILAFDINTDEDSYSSLKSLLHRCLNDNGGILPFKISCQVTNRTWNSYLRNIQMLGVELNYCHPHIDDYSELKRLINSIRVFSKGLTNIDLLKTRAKRIIDSYNDNHLENQCSYKELFHGLLEALYDNCIKTTDKELEMVLSNTYKEALKQIFGERCNH